MAVHFRGKGPGHMSRVPGDASGSSPPTNTIYDRAASAIVDRAGSTILARV